MLVGILSPSPEREQEVLAEMLDRMEVLHESVGAEAFISRLGRYSVLLVPSGCQALEDCTDEDIEDWLTPFTAEGGRVLLLAAGAEEAVSPQMAQDTVPTSSQTASLTAEILAPDHLVFQRPNALSAQDLQALAPHLRPSALPRRAGITLLKCQSQPALVDAPGWGDKAYCAGRRVQMLYCRLPLDTLAGAGGVEQPVALRLLENVVWHTLFWNFMVGHGLYTRKERREKRYLPEVPLRDLGLVDLRRILQTPQSRLRLSQGLHQVWRYSSDVSVDGDSVSSPDFNDAAWREVRLPSPASERGWFRTSFALAQDWRGKNLFLEIGFGGEGEVWLNGHLAGVFLGCSRSVQLPEPFFGERENILAIRSVAGAPASLSLLGTSLVSIAEVGASPDLNHSEVAVDVLLRNSSNKDADGLLQASCFPITKPGPLSASPKVAFHLPPGQEASIHLLVPVDNPLLWSPENPDLHNLTVALESDDQIQDEACTVFGIRTFEVKDGDFYLNGQRRFLKGVTDLGNWTAPGWEPTARSLLLAKLLGADFTRTDHPSEELATLCDFLGILIVQGLGETNMFSPRRMKLVDDETGGLPPGWQRRATGIAREEIARRSEAVARHVVRSMRQHPSVIMWELSSESPAYLWEVWEKVCPRLMDAVRELDPQERPVIPSSCVSPCDEGLTDTDVGWNMAESEAARRFFADNPGAVYTSHIYCGWYNDRIQTIYQLPTTVPDRPFGIAEFGAEGLPDFSTMDTSPRKSNISQAAEFSIIKYWTGICPNLDDYWGKSQEYQAVLVRTLVEYFRALAPQVDDLTIHTWRDTPGQHKGILDMEGRPKKAFWEAKEALAPLAITVAWDEKVVFAGEPVSFRLTVLNDHPHSFFAGLRWQVETVDGSVLGKGREELRVEANSADKPNPLVWEVPPSARGGFYYLQATLETLAGQTLCTREFEFQVVPRGATELAACAGASGTSESGGRAAIL